MVVNLDKFQAIATNRYNQLEDADRFKYQKKTMTPLKLPFYLAFNKLVSNSL